MVPTEAESTSSKCAGIQIAVFRVFHGRFLKKKIKINLCRGRFRGSGGDANQLIFFKWPKYNFFSVKSEPQVMFILMFMSLPRSHLFSKNKLRPDLALNIE